MRFAQFVVATKVTPLPTGEVGAERRVRGYGPSVELRPLARIALDDASHRQERSDLSPPGR